ncbi:ATP/GTP-binding protein [Streptomyces sp. Tu 6176]|uniref:ATP/GTP-binding protein n=1 Tax=Streptomyces sp. Tu 6176 TaxID=1470557 RepID=UPI001F20DC80|nr:ATP/GTP-binding protein [Streptomyces sp. Tu 6176]
MAEEAQRRWDKRRAAEKDKAGKGGEAGKDGDAKDPVGGEEPDATTKNRKTSKDGHEPSADGPFDKEPGDGKASGEKPSGGSDRPGDETPVDDTATDGSAKPDGDAPPPDGDTSASGEDTPASESDEGVTPSGAEESSGTARPEDFGVTIDSPGRPNRPPDSDPQEDDIPDAVIVDDPFDPFGATVTSRAGLPRAPEPHTQRPGTTRPTAQEDFVASEVSTPTKARATMTAQHRTDITFSEYMLEIVNIAITAGVDRDRARDLVLALAKVARALRDMATDLVGDHNIATEVIGQVTDLADAATRMKQIAEQCADECDTASEAARLAAVSVGRVYSQDIDAMNEAGLAHASAAAHHD